MTDIKVTINVEEIMSQIRKDIESKLLVDDIVEFEDIALDEIDDVNCYSDQDFSQRINSLRQSLFINSYRNITSRRGITGKVIIFLKKIIRKCICFYIEPIVHEQNNINLLIGECMEDIKRYTLQQQTYKDEFDDLEFVFNNEIMKRFKILQSNNESLSSQNEMLSKENIELVAEFSKLKESNIFLQRQIEIIQLEQRKLSLLLQNITPKEGNT